MWDFFGTPALAPFIIAGFVLLILLVVEIISFMFGGMSGFLDNLLPDSLVDADFDADMDVDAGSDLSLGLKALDWLYVGRIPTMILLILFIASFCITGFVIQQVAFSILGNFISPWLASLDALVISVPVLKILASLLYPILPKDESTAVSGDTLVGRQARIILGTASVGHPAQAKLTDAHGQMHYVMVEPEPSDMTTSDPSLLSLNDNHQKPAAATTITTLSAEDQLIITKKIGERYWVKKM